MLLRNSLDGLFCACVFSWLDPGPCKWRQGSKLRKALLAIFCLWTRCEQLPPAFNSSTSSLRWAAPWNRSQTMFFLRCFQETSSQRQGEKLKQAPRLSFFRHRRWLQWTETPSRGEKWGKLLKPAKFYNQNKKLKPLIRLNVKTGSPSYSQQEWRGDVTLEWWNNLQ